MAPGISLIIPWYLTFRFMGLLGTHFAISISHVLITAPLLGWLLVSFFDKIPVALEEAAIIDGCSRYGALARAGSCCPWPHRAFSAPCCWPSRGPGTTSCSPS